ncbi:MAG: VOC family protein [Halobacteriaceae archaeon]
MPTPESFFHVAVKTADLDASVAFYREHLGAELQSRVEGDGGGADDVSHAVLSVGDKRVYLFAEAPYEAAGLVEDVPPGFLHFGFVVDDVAAAHESLAAAGAEFIMEPTAFGSLKIAFFTDPDGTRIELIEELD